MAKVYCKKCGLRGHSKCPYCRSVFSETNHGSLAQDIWENLGCVTDLPGEDNQFLVGSRVFAENEEEALRKGVTILGSFFTDPEFNMQVAGCVHEWALMPGERSSIGCGHVGEQSAIVPPDPYTKEIAVVKRKTRYQFHGNTIDNDEFATFMNNKAIIYRHDNVDGTKGGMPFTTYEGPMDQLVELIEKFYQDMPYVNFNRI
jgi:hypothetical protein